MTAKPLKQPSRAPVSDSSYRTEAVTSLAPSACQDAGAGISPCCRDGLRYREEPPPDAASRRRAFCTDGSAALAFASGRARTSTLAGLAAIVISAPVAGLRPVRFLVAGLTRTVELDEASEPDLLGIAQLPEDDLVEGVERPLRVGLAHLGAVRDRRDHLGLGQRHDCSSSSWCCVNSGIEPLAADGALSKRPSKTVTVTRRVQVGASSALLGFGHGLGAADSNQAGCAALTQAAPARLSGGGALDLPAARIRASAESSTAPRSRC